MDRKRLSMLVGSAILGALIAPSAALAQEPDKDDKSSQNKLEVVTENFIGADDDDFLEFTTVAEDPAKPGEKSSPTTRSYRVTRPARVNQVVTMYRVVQPLMDSFGLRLAEADDALRAQLAIPPGEGVVIVEVRPESLADQAGLKVNDVLLGLGNTTVKGVAETAKVLEGLTHEAIPARLIRQGKRTQLSVVGPEHGKASQPVEFWIGVPVSPVDGTLRAHLASLPEGAGLVANDVVAGSPAEAAGLKKNDILISLNQSKPLRNSEELIAAIQSSGGKPVPLEILTVGKPLTLTITPASRPPTTNFVAGITGETVYQNMIPKVAISSQRLSPAQIQNLQKEVRQQVGPDGKIDVTHRLSGQKIQIDANHAITWAQSQDPEMIRLRLTNERLRGDAETRTLKMESQLKEISEKVDAILRALKKPEAK